MKTMPSFNFSLPSLERLVQESRQFGREYIELKNTYKSIIATHRILRKRNPHQFLLHMITFDPYRIPRHTDGFIRRYKDELESGKKNVKSNRSQSAYLIANKAYLNDLSRVIVGLPISRIH